MANKTPEAYLCQEYNRVMIVLYLRDWVVKINLAELASSYTNLRSLRLRPCNNPGRYCDSYLHVVVIHGTMIIDAGI